MLDIPTYTCLWWCPVAHSGVLLHAAGTLLMSMMSLFRKTVKHSRDDMSVLEPSMEEAVDELIGGVQGGMQQATGSDDEKSMSDDKSVSVDEEDCDTEEEDSEVSADEIGAHSTDPRYDLHFHDT